ncbi:DNA internalization-related competence protein ComEC/Rec2 [Vibrio renipiscarius]|uniref:DNA internalization-related competence protein ComEC/Rec2 n=1 Tax=Vibrio renipiscarius TaxID=1461322 RepID=UPI00354BFCDF
MWIWSVPCLGWLLLSINCRRLRWGSGIALALIVVLISGNLLRHQSNTLFQAGSNIIINAKVDSLFKPIKHGFRGVALVRSINGEILNEISAPKVYLTTPQHLQLGDEITARVTLKPIVGVLNELGFDREKQAISQGIVGAASLNVKSSYFIKNRPSIRQLLFNRMFHASESLPHQGLLLALSFGERAYIPPSQWRALQQSGLSHLIAISGLHVGIAFSVGWLIGFCLLRLRFRTVWLPMICAGFVAFGYSWLAGFTIPTQRALWMVGVLITLHFIGIKTSYRFTWLVVVASLLLVQPLAAYAASFWLSVTAVAIIFMFLSLRLPLRTTWLKAVLMQGCLVISMALVVAWLYQGAGAHSLLYNLVFVPWFSLIIIPLLLVALVLNVFSASLSLWLFELVDRLLVPVSGALLWSDWLWFDLSKSSVLWLAMGCTLLLLSVLIQKRTLAIILLSLVLMFALRRDEPDWQMDILDVGHGLAVVIKKNGHVLLYDTGAAWQRRELQRPELRRSASASNAEVPSEEHQLKGSYAQQVIIPLLLARGHRVDGVIISHFDSDHSGGLESILNRWPEAKVWSSQRPETSGALHQACVAGQHWQWQGLNIEVLWPPKLTSRAYNPHSCVVRLHDEFGHSVLLTGDIEAVAEWMLLRSDRLLASDLLVVPHHGSKTSSSSQFIARVNPQISIASSAYQGRWQLPNSAVKARYIEAGAKWLDTGMSGQITFHYRGKIRQLTTMRSSKGRAWYRQMLRKRVE